MERYRKQPAPLKELLDKPDGGAARRAVTEILPLRRIWTELMGEKIAEISSPYLLNNGILNVAVYEQIWLAEFPYIKKEMIAKIKGIGVEISDIRFKLSIRKVSELPVQEETTPLTEEQKAKIERLSGNISDKGIRDAYAAAFAAFLKRGNR